MRWPGRKADFGHGDAHWRNGETAAQRDAGSHSHSRPGIFAPGICVLFLVPQVSGGGGAGTALSVPVLERGV